MGYNYGAFYVVFWHFQAQNPLSVGKEIMEKNTKNFLQDLLMVPQETIKQHLLEAMIMQM